MYTNSRATLSAPELAECLGISRAGAYNLMQANGFPSFRIGKRVMVTKAAFEKWLEEQQRKGGVNSWATK